jgi:hypothetical protein
VHGFRFLPLREKWNVETKCKAIWLLNQLRHDIHTFYGRARAAVSGEAPELGEFVRFCAWISVFAAS